MMTFSKGERLTADKMNALARQLGGGDESVPGLGFKGRTMWGQDRDTKQAQRVRAPETFQMNYVFDDDVIKGFKISNCRFFEGGVLHTLPDQVVEPDAPRSVESLNLVELSAPLQAPNPRYRVLDNIAIEMEYPTDEGISVANQWPLYFMSDSFVCCDVRTSFVQTAAGSGGGGGGAALDLSSTNWGELTSTEPGSETTAVVQNWNYQSPEPDDLLDVQDAAGAGGIRFLVRPEGGGTLKYASLSAVLSGGGGGGEETTLEGNTPDSEKIGPGDLNFEAMASCNISVETAGTTIKLGVFYT